MSATNICNSANLDMEALTRFLCRAFPYATANHVEGITGVSAATITNWLIGRAKPSGEHLGALVGAFGPQFVAAAFPASRTWAEPIARAENARRLATELAEILAAE